MVTIIEMATVYLEKPDENFSQDTFTDSRSAEICKYFKELLEVFDCKCWIAGGSIVSKYIDQEINDVDVFFTSEEDIINTKDNLLSLGATIEFENEFSLKIKYKDTNFDLVSITDNGPKETITKFDMICCAVAVDQKGQLHYMDGFFQDLNSKEIRFNKDCEIASYSNRILQRINKYGKKGFNLSLKESDKFLKLIEKVKKQEDLSGKKDPGSNWRAPAKQTGSYFQV